MLPREVEVDTEVQRRRRVVHQVRSATPQPEPVIGLKFTELLDRAGTIIDQFLRPLAKLSKPEGRDAIDDLLAAAVAVDQLVLDTSVPQPRPHLRVGRLLHDICVMAHGCLHGFLDAFGAETLLKAEDLGARAQEKLDSAIAQIGELTQAQDELLQLMSASDSGFYELMAQRVVAGTAEGILGADRLGRDVVQRIITAGEAPCEGVGLGVLWAATYAQVLFDYDRFCSIAATLYRLLKSPGAFDALVADDEWRTWHKDAHTKLADAGETLQNMLAVAQHDRAAVRAVLLFAQDIYEGACRHFAATILAHLGTGTYSEHMQNRQKRPLVQYLRDNAAGYDLAVGLLGPLRNASGHNDYEVRDGLIVLGRGQSETVLTDAQFADMALMFTESATALSLTFEVALLQRGIPTAVEDDQSLLSPETMLRLLVASAGLSDIVVDLSADTTVITGAGTLRSPMPTIGALLLALPDTTTTLILGWQESDRTRILNVPLDVARAHAALPSGTLEQELAFLELCSLTKLDDAPLLTQAGFRHSVALKAGAVVQGTPQEFGTRFRMLRALCTRVGDDDFAETLRLVMRAQRLIAIKELADARTKQAVDDLLAWEQQRVPSPFAE
ncbi:MAG: hypothetical protein ABI047_01095 [Jatrophihabitantaceae bacterium]